MPTDDKGLKSFKISDQVKKPVEKPRPWARAAPQGDTGGGSAGFPRIEALVESSAPDLAGFDKRAADLEEMAKSAKTPKDKNAPKKAAGAYKTTRALIDYLLETKSKLASGGGG